MYSSQLFGKINMKVFRSKIFQYSFGIIFAISVYLSLSTPISGSFRDVAILSMVGVSDKSPVKLKSISAIDESRKMQCEDFTGEKRTVIVPSNVQLTPGEDIVANLSYNPSDSSYVLRSVIRVSPLFTFPLIQGLGELGRNILFHVPMSFVAFIVFLISTIYSILYIRKRDLKYDLQARAYSSLGLLFTFLATVTGSIWARFSWGVFWNFNEPRESSILVLMLIYIAYFLLRHLMEDSEEKVARVAAVYNVIAFATVPFLMFVLPRITQSLHPGGGGTEAPVINLSGKSYIDPALKIMMWANVTLFLILAVWVKDVYVRITNMENKKWSS